MDAVAALRRRVARALQRMEASRDEREALDELTGVLDHFYRCYEYVKLSLGPAVFHERLQADIYGSTRALAWVRAQDVHKFVIMGKLHEANGDKYYDAYSDYSGWLIWATRPTGLAPDKHRRDFDYDDFVRGRRVSEAAAEAVEALLSSLSR